MIDPKFLRSDIQEVAEKLLTKNFQLDCESFNLLDSERKSLQSKLEKLLQERNSHAKKIGMKITENGPADNSVKELKIIGEDLKNQSSQIETELSTVKHKINAILEIIPNLPDSSVPKGKGEEDNLVIRKWGSPKMFGFDILDHVELGNNIGQMDFDVATKKLTITQRPRADDETVLMHTDNFRPDITLFKDIYSKPWIRDYTLAVSKIMLGEARGKFNTIAGPQGGTTLNGDALKAEGQAEIERLESDIGNFQEGGTPHSFVIG